jgi:hypothetical protein
MSEIEEIISKVKAEFPNIIVFKLNEIGEIPFEFGVWQFWLEGNETARFSVEIQHGFCYVCYPSKDLANKDEIKDADVTKWICNYFNAIQMLEK